MATKHQDMQRAIHHYVERTGKTEYDMHDVAVWAVRELGMKLPPPVDPMTRLAKEFSKAAREEVRRDEVTGRPYRANHAATVPGKNGSQMTLWGDIDKAKREFIHTSLTQRREQMVGDGFQLTLDADHWNSRHQDEKPIHIELDFTHDVEWRKNAPDEDKKAG